jgi:hypothetical protein
MLMSNGLAACGVCGAEIEYVAQTDNAEIEGPTDPQQRKVWLKEQINEVGSKFSNYGFNLNQLYDGTEMITALQANSMSQLLIRKGIITKDELDIYFYELMLEKFKDHERVILPQLREAAIKATVMPNPNGEADMKGMLGPDGKPLF